MPSKAKAPAHRPGVSESEHALFCYLRLHPSVAAAYGIKECNGMTTIGSMLSQTLAAQGMAVDWYTQLPNDAPGHAAVGSNEAGAQYIKKVGTRPGNRLKNLKDRLKELERSTSAVPETAAVRKRGGLPKVSFPLLLSLARTKRKRAFSSRGNLIGPPADVALVERDSITSYVTKQLRCLCGGRLAFCNKASSQVGVGAAWTFVCERSCKLPPRETGKRLHGDDYMLNSKLNYACITCAIPFERLVACLTVLGTRAPSTTDHYMLKHGNDNDTYDLTSLTT